MREVEIAFGARMTPSREDILKACASLLGVNPDKITSYEVVKKSLDARGHEIFYRYRVKTTTGAEPLLEPYIVADYKNVKDAEPVIIIGAGPAGLFAALKLLQLGKRPVILERGKDVHQRKFDMAKLSKEQIVNPNSNYCFGEGGAGTFSDGKLYTRSNKKGDIRQVLHQFVKFGADPSILTDAHAHIGSDKLPRVIENMRNCILEHGGEVHFNTRVVDFERKGGEWLVKCVDCLATNKCSVVPEFSARKIILATGHSARDIYELFFKKGWAIQEKGFALGVRVEHPQSLINNIQYKNKYQPYLPAAEYSLVCQIDGRGVFSFCMCPGGILVPSATAPGEMLLNGMSNSMRNSKWANAGIVVSVEPGDVTEFAEYGPLQLMKFQQSVEQKMFEYGGGSLKAPAQRMDDFVKSRLSENLPATSYVPGTYSAPLHELLPPFVVKRMQKAFFEFNRKMRGYFTSQALLLAVESRTSSPVRIPRNLNTLQHITLENIYPCGEGAGYAGGIVSCALDGINVAKAIGENL
ncbi:MAG: NAD(P)/FAD-dependent oxidoreductase [Bacteroidales bacterium]